MLDRFFCVFKNFYEIDAKIVEKLLVVYKAESINFKLKTYLNENEQEMYRKIFFPKNKNGIVEIIETKKNNKHFEEFLMNLFFSELYYLGFFVRITENNDSYYKFTNSYHKYHIYSYIAYHKLFFLVPSASEARLFNYILSGIIRNLSQIYMLSISNKFEEKHSYYSVAQEEIKNNFTNLLEFFLFNENIYLKRISYSHEHLFRMSQEEKIKFVLRNFTHYFFKFLTEKDANYVLEKTQEIETVIFDDFELSSKNIYVSSRGVFSLKLKESIKILLEVYFLRKDIHNDFEKIKSKISTPSEKFESKSLQISLIKILCFEKKYIEIIAEDIY